MRSIASHEAELKNQSISRAIYYSLFVASTLLILKVFVGIMTNSSALKAVSLDSLFDTILAIINIFVLKITNKEANKNFPFGYDKIISFTTLIHSIVVSFITLELFKECIEKIINPEEIGHFHEAVIVLIISILLNLILVAYQKKVVKQTKSMLVEADMIHFKADAIAHGSILIGFIAVWAFDIVWLDPIIGLGACLYLIYSIWPITKTSIASILDMNDTCCVKEISDKLLLQKIRIKNDDIFVLFTGKTHRLFIKVVKLEEIEAIKAIIHNNFPEFDLYIIANN